MAKTNEKRETLLIEDAQIFGGRYRNFRGEPTRFNPSGGVRTFCVAIPDEKLANQLTKDGWNVKYTPEREDSDDPPIPFLTVEVGFKFPPTIVLLTERARTKITEDTIEVLDSVQIKTADLIINPGFWTDDQGTPRIKAWLKSLYITLEEDFLDKKYSIDDREG